MFHVKHFLSSLITVGTGKHYFHSGVDFLLIRRDSHQPSRLWILLSSTLPHQRSMIILSSDPHNVNGNRLPSLGVVVEKLRCEILGVDRDDNMVESTLDGILDDVLFVESWIDQHHF